MCRHPRLAPRAAASCALLSALLATAGALANDRPESRLADAAMRGDAQTVRALLAEGADANEFGTYATAALHWMIRVQDFDTAQRLLLAGADPNLATGHGVRPLHLAIENADLPIVELLLDAGADPRRRDAANESALFVAARSGTPEIARALLERGANVDEREPHFQQTPLMVAVRADNAGIAALLIGRGANVNAQSVAGEEPAWRLPHQNAGSRGVGIIRGGWPERGQRAPVPGAKTPLLYATRQGDPELVRLLVDAGADLELADADGVTPLLNAIINASLASRRPGGTGHFEVARYLIEQGADVNVADWYGQTPLWVAVSVRNLDVRGPSRDNGVDRAAALELIRNLLARGADPNARTQEYPPERRFITGLGDLSWVDFTGETPFLRAALSGDATVMRLLLEHGADPSISTHGGTTALMAAAGVNWVVNQTFDEGPEALLEAVRLAWEAGNDIEAVNAMGLTAIHGAANRGSNDIIEFLASKGARLDLPDREGRTPLVWAEGVFLATHPPERKPDTLALLERLMAQ
jgi:uncharacterized protein